MWKKEEAGSGGQEDGGKDATGARREAPAPPLRGARGEPATIGPSIVIHGEVTGDEDLLIEGRVDGTVDLQAQSVTVGPEGRVKADIKGRIVTVEGEVEGDLEAAEQAILRGSARVKGDITAPRVTLEDGALFRGLIDMGEPKTKADGAKGRSGSLASATTSVGADPGDASASGKGVPSGEGSGKKTSS